MERRKIKTGRGMMMRCWYDNRTKFLIILAPSVSIEDRTVVGPSDHVELY